MTDEECLNICKIAIKCFESKYSEILPVNNDCLEDFINQISKKEEERQAISIIRDALEKQIPQKPQDCNGERMCECGNIIKSYQKYCMECGQAIDWEELRISI